MHHVEPMPALASDEEAHLPGLSFCLVPFFIWGKGRKKRSREVAFQLPESQTWRARGGGAVAGPTGTAGLPCTAAPKASPTTMPSTAPTAHSTSRGGSSRASRGCTSPWRAAGLRRLLGALACQREPDGHPRTVEKRWVFT